MTKELPAHAYIRPLQIADLEQCVALEAAGFPPAERASRDKIKYRLTACPELCAGVFIRTFKDPKYSEDGSSAAEQTEGADDDNNNDESGATGKSGLYVAKSSLAEEKLIGHILATKIAESKVTDASMEIPDLDEYNRVRDPAKDKRGHRDDGRTLAVHAVVVDPAYHGQSIGSLMLKDYIQRMTTLHVADRIAILVHDKLKPFYALQDFEDLGPSEVTFSGGSWIDMVRPLSDSDDDE